VIFFTLLENSPKIFATKRVIFFILFNSNLSQFVETGEFDTKFSIAIIIFITSKNFKIEML